MASKTVAVAGATGNAGREIVRALAERGLAVRALVRNPDKLGDTRAHCGEVEIVQATERESLRGKLDGCRYAVSALGKTFQRDSVRRRAVDVEANVDLFEEAKQAGVGRFALLSVAQARADHPVAMVAMKGEAEAALRASGLPYVIIRPSGFFSDMWEIFRMCEKGTYWNVGDGSVKLNPISLVDLGDYVAESLLDDAKEGKVLEVGGPDTYTSDELADVAARVLGRPVRKRHLPVGLARGVVSLLKPFSRNLWELGDFFVGGVEYALDHLDGDATVPAYGTHHLEDYFRQRWERERAERVAGSALPRS